MAEGLTPEDASRDLRFMSKLPPGHAARRLLFTIRGFFALVAALGCLGLLIWGLVGGPIGTGWAGIVVFLFFSIADLINTGRKYRRFARTGELSRGPGLPHPSQIPAFAVLGIFAALMVAAGFVMPFVGALTQETGSDEFWAIMLVSLTCILGGGGFVALSWNAYRRVEGAPSLLEDPGWTVFDKIVLIVVILGVASSISNVVFSRWLTGQSTYAPLILGAPPALIALAILVYRAVARFVAREERDAKATRETGEER